MPPAPKVATDDNLAIYISLLCYGMVFIGGLMVIYLVVRFLAFRTKENTRREVMKSVAEGKMSADDAERLLNAGKSEDEIKF